MQDKNGKNSFHLFIEVVYDEHSRMAEIILCSHAMIQRLCIIIILSEKSV